VDNDTVLINAVIQSYRGDLRKRYSLENIHRFHEFKNISDSIIDDLRNFFLEYLYPEPERRVNLDNAIDRLSGVLSSPRKIRPLIGIAGRSFFKLGTLIPSAIRSGIRALEAYLHTRKMEKMMVRHAKANKTDASVLSDPEEFLRIISLLPEKEIVGFRKVITNLFKSMSNLKVITISIEILEDSKKIMKKRTDIFSRQEIDGLTLGYNMLIGGRDLYLQLKPDQVDMIHRGINSVEYDWYENVKSYR